jgi:MFS family permease
MKVWNRATLGLVAGSTLAGAGAWIDFLAILTLAAYEHGANAFLMAFISALFLLPSMVLAPRVGRWIDRTKPEAILTGSLLLRCSATALLLLDPSIPLFCVLVAVRSTLTIPTEPASNALVTRLVRRDDVPRYFGVLGVLRNASKIAAPTIGAAIASRYGEAHAIGVSVAMTLAAVALLFFALRGAAPVDAASSPSDAAAMPASAALPTMNRSLLGQLLWTVTIYAFMVFLVNNQLPVLLRNAGFDRALLGVLVSCSGAGGILAAAFMSRRGAAAALGADPMRATIVSVLATAACFILLGLAFSLPVSLASTVAGGLFFCTGVFASIEAIRSSTVVVQHFPGAVGEVTATLNAWQSGAVLVAPWIAALVIPHVTMSTLFLADGGIALAVLIAATLGFRRADTRRRSLSNASAVGG